MIRRVELGGRRVGRLRAPRALPASAPRLRRRLRLRTRTRRRSRNLRRRLRRYQSVRLSPNDKRVASVLRAQRHMHGNDKRTFVPLFVVVVVVFSRMYMCMCVCMYVRAGVAAQINVPPSHTTATTRRSAKVPVERRYLQRQIPPLSLLFLSWWKTYRNKACERPAARRQQTNVRKQ